MRTKGGQAVLLDSGEAQTFELVGDDREGSWVLPIGR